MQAKKNKLLVNKIMSIISEHFSFNDSEDRSSSQITGHFINDQLL